MWETIEETAQSLTERMRCGGGYLVRSVWRHVARIGGEPLDGSALVWVAGDVAAPAVIQAEQVTEPVVEAASDVVPREPEPVADGDVHEVTS